MWQRSHITPYVTEALINKIFVCLETMSPQPIILPVLMKPPHPLRKLFQKLYSRNSAGCHAWVLSYRLLLHIPLTEPRGRLVFLADSPRRQLRRSRSIVLWPERRENNDCSPFRSYVYHLPLSLFCQRTDDSAWGATHIRAVVVQHYDVGSQPTGGVDYDSYLIEIFTW